MVLSAFAESVTGASNVAHSEGGMEVEVVSNSVVNNVDRD